METAKKLRYHHSETFTPTETIMRPLAIPTILADQDCRSEGQWSATGPVEGHELLHLAAQIHADDMADNDFFNHTGSDGSSFSQRIYDTGYNGSPMAENIAAGGTDPASIVDRWLDSDGHCRNLMIPTATEIGVGFTYGGNWGTLWVLKVARGS